MSSTLLYAPRCFCGALASRKFTRYGFGVVALMFAVGASVQTSLQPALGADCSEWVFQQNHFDNGKNQIFLAANAVKIVSQSGGFNLVARAPAWKIVLFRPDDKIAYVTDMSGLRQFSVFGPITPAKPQQLPLVKIGTEKQKDLDVTSYRTIEPFRKFWLADVPVSRSAVDIIRIYYRTLDGCKESGIPIKYVMHRGPAKAARKHSWMNESHQLESGDKDWLTTEGWKMVPFNASDFEYPSGYKNVKTASELLVSGAQKQDLDLLINDLGIGAKSK